MSRWDDIRRRLKEWWRGAPAAAPSTSAQPTTGDDAAAAAAGSVLVTTMLKGRDVDTLERTMRALAPKFPRDSYTKALARLSREGYGLAFLALSCTSRTSLGKFTCDPDSDRSRVLGYITEANLLGIQVSVVAHCGNAPDTPAKDLEWLRAWARILKGRVHSMWVGIECEESGGSGMSTSQIHAAVDTIQAEGVSALVHTASAAALARCAGRARWWGHQVEGWQGNLSEASFRAQVGEMMRKAHAAGAKYGCIEYAFDGFTQDAKALGDIAADLGADMIGGGASEVGLKVMKARSGGAGGAVGTNGTTTAAAGPVTLISVEVAGHRKLRLGWAGVPDSWWKTLPNGKRAWGWLLLNGKRVEKVGENAVRGLDNLVTSDYRQHFSPGDTVKVQVADLNGKNASNSVNFMWPTDWGST